MKKMTIEEQRKVMLDILLYIDDICRKNDICYSLIGGSLIGAIRHSGFIPWDDDVDIILTYDNYEKLINILKHNDNSKYKVLSHDLDKNYFFPFVKVVDTDTYVIEENCLEQIKDYGVYVDVFVYNNVSNDNREREKFVKKLKLLNSMLSRKPINYKEIGLKQSILRLGKNTLSKILGYNKIHKIINKHNVKYNNQITDYVVSNWPIYAINKEVQLASDLDGYIDVNFEGEKIMIFKSYDNVLRNTFGDYMVLPPVEKRYSHGLKAFWKDDNNEE